MPSKKDIKVTQEEALAKQPNKNQDDLINTVFSIAEKHGGLWMVSFKSDYVTIYRKDGLSRSFNYSEFGYSSLQLYNTITCKGRIFEEFPLRLKNAAEKRGYLFWTTKELGFVESNTYTSYDGGNSYSRDKGSGGTFTTAANVCSNEYYQKYKPYNYEGDKPLKKL